MIFAQPLKININGFDLYKAGIGYPRNFPRDSLTAGILASDPQMLANQIHYCNTKLGKAKNPITGEEPGKDFHEDGGVVIRELSTEYNNCDVTAMALIAYAKYYELTKDAKFVKAQQKFIRKRVNYIICHINPEGLFIEDPKFSDALSYALKVTYWKDSEIPARTRGEPVYPIVYTLAHIQNMCGLRAAAKLLNDENISKMADKMARALNLLWDSELGTFFIAKDVLGPIRGISSDSLHALFYLEPGDLTRRKIASIEKSSRMLETPIGYTTLDPLTAIKVDDPYHSKVIWTHEQAIIHAGAAKFGLTHVAEVSRRITTMEDINFEHFMMTEGGNYEGRANPQLWAVAAKTYFLSQPTGNPLTNTVKLVK